ncbi:MAG: acetoacetate decarboxylase family protein [Cloacibacillus sp.]
MFHGRSFTMPDAAPLYSGVPINYKGFRKLSVLCKADPAGIRKTLPAVFTPLGDVIEVFLMNVVNVDGLDPYMEGGIVIPCKYEETIGAHVVYEYVTDDDSMAAGREIWGYPKKLSTMTFVEDGDKVSSTLCRRNTMLIGIDFEKKPNASDYERPIMQPRLQLKRFVRADGSGFDMDQIICNTLTDSIVHERYLGNAKVTLNGTKQDPLNWLMPLEVIGAEFIVADFVLGYGTVLKEKY